MAIADLIKIKPVQAFLMDGSVMTVFEAILEKFAMDKNRATELLDLTDAVLDGQLELKDIPAMIAQAFGVEEERSVRMACDVVGFRLLPLEQYVPGIIDQMTAWGADMSKYPKSRVGKQKMLPDTFAAQLDTQLELNFSEVLVKRAGFLIWNYWTGEKTKESTLTFFSRATTIGGLGISPEQSQRLLEAVDASRDLVELIPGTPGEVSPPIEDSGEVAVKEIEKEFEGVVGEERVSTTKELEVAPSHEVAAEVPVVNAPTPQPPTNLPQLNQPPVMKPALAEDWSDEIKDAERKAKQIQAIESNAPVPIPQPTTTNDQRPTADSSLDTRFAAITKDAPKEHVEEVLPGARVSLARTAEEERAKQTAAIPQEKLVEAEIASRPEPVKPMLTVGSVAPNQMTRPVTDIQPVKRLMSPIDELGTMSPAEFRRLSTVPADAIQKIEDILSTLEQQAYEERVKGITAWRKSPMNQLYVAMTTAALMQGVAVAEIAAKRRAAGEESLSPAEIRAVSQLNEKLRF